jgi:hypothetical protein
MTATKDRLAAELRKVADCKTDRSSAYEALAVRAATGEFDDYSDVHVCGPTALHRELLALGARIFAARVADGEFDACLSESEEWARKQTDPEVIAIMNAMGIGPNRSNDQ